MLIKITRAAMYIYVVSYFCENVLKFLNDIPIMKFLD